MRCTVIIIMVYSEFEQDQEQYYAKVFSLHVE